VADPRARRRHGKCDAYGNATTKIKKLKLSLKMQHIVFLCHSSNMSMACPTFALLCYWLDTQIALFVEHFLLFGCKTLYLRFWHPLVSPHVQKGMIN
jgi:hypothetical protein